VKEGEEYFAETMGLIEKSKEGRFGKYAWEEGPLLDEIRKDLMTREGV